MMALHVGLRRATPPAAIVGYSGMFVMPDDGPPETVAGRDLSRPPVLLIHGDGDELIPVAGPVSRIAGAVGAGRARSNGTFRPVSAMASTRKACATAANSWPGGSASKPLPRSRRGTSQGPIFLRFYAYAVSARPAFTFSSRSPIMTGLLSPVLERSAIA